MKTVREMKAAVADGKITPEELIQNTLADIETWNPHTNAYLQIFTDEVASQIERAAEYTDGPLAGIPVAVKDNIATKIGKTTAASKILEEYRSPYDATVIRKLEKAGAIIVGKTNLDEFAMGSSTEYSAFGTTKNPWDTSRVPGGSSGGSAAAVASGTVPLAFGTDTGGSIRQPASLCGVVGVKPTYGRVSRFGAISYGSSLDQIGPFARTVHDAALLLEVISGIDPLDATTADVPVVQYSKHLDIDVSNITIGVPKEFFEEGTVPEVEEAVRGAIAWYEKQGARIQEISLPLTSAGVAIYFLIAKAEGASNLSRYDALRFGKMDLESDDLIERYMEARGKGFGPEVKRTILMGTYALSAGYYDAWYKQASKVRTLIRREYEEAFKSVDVIMGPVSPETAFPIGSKTDDPLQMYLTDAFTVPVSVAGLPALSLPCGMASGLPVGLQVIAPHFEEQKMFAVSHVYEQAHEWSQMMPSLPQGV